MEVVLSPGRFGDETPGVPFQNEEIREWSHVDRLTGMLERARVETGRWQTSNEGAARSYGKVIDSRERNSADGSVVQRARRQVEIFQSQGSGRSVQVVRASQWSSSKVTDSTSTNPVALTAVEQKVEEEEKKLGNLSNLDLPPKSHYHHQEAISERLSTLLGSFAYPISSTVPLRRTDSKYSGRAALLRNFKRSSSIEDLTSLSSRDKNYPQRSQTTETIEAKTLGHRMGNSNETRILIGEISVKCDDEENIGARLEMLADNGKKNSGLISLEAELPSRSSAKSAIHLLPPSKANTTVVNLINSDSHVLIENDTRDAKGPLVSWIGPTSSLVQELSRTNGLENLISRGDAKIEESTNSSTSGRSIKRVGFSKTEIHFAADSGKVNIVETDEKPPPTNKFRRRRRLTGITSNKHLPNINPSAYEPKILRQTNVTMNNDRCISHDEINMKIDPNLQRGHTTTVNFGSDGTKNDEQGFQSGHQYCKIHQDSSFPEDLDEAPSHQGILLRFENRIYDRLESYSSNLGGLSMKMPRDIAAGPEMEIQASALKSARLVMNLTKSSNVSSVSKILMDSSSSRQLNDEELRGIESLVYSNRKYQGQPAIIRYLDWKADNEDQSIMHGGDDVQMSSQQVENSRELISITSSKETENIHESRGSLQIANDEAKLAAELLSATKKDTSPHEASTKIERGVTRQDYDVMLCTDAENNQVLLKVVTTHEPTIARVKNDQIRKRLKKATKLEKPAKNQVSKSKKPQREHTYVNVFTGSDTEVPIYENYKISDPYTKNNKIRNSIIIKEKSCPPETISRILDTKYISTNWSVRTRQVENVKLAKEKMEVEKKTIVNTEISCNNDGVNLSIGSKKTRIKTKDNKLVPDGSKKTAGELSPSNSTNSTVASRSRTNKFSTNPTTTIVPTNAPIQIQDSISSCDKDLKLSTEISKASGQKPNAFKFSPREISSTRMKKGEIVTSKFKPMEVVYQTAVYNMKNVKLSKPPRGKEPRGSKYLNDLICGAIKTKRPSDSKNGKTSSITQNAVNTKGALHTVRQWK